MYPFNTTIKHQNATITNCFVFFIFDNYKPKSILNRLLKRCTTNTFLTYLTYFFNDSIA